MVDGAGHDNTRAPSEELLGAQEVGTDLGEVAVVKDGWRIELPAPGVYTIIRETHEAAIVRDVALVSERSYPWTWAWYRGRVGHELRWLPWSVARVLRGESRWYAPIRALWHSLVLMYECEICEVCGHPVAAVWHAEDALWLRVNGHYSGTTCASCFNKKAERAGASPYWEVHDGEYPTCAGSPCVHVAPMRIQSEAATEYWEALVRVTGSHDAARLALDTDGSAVSTKGSPNV